MGRDSRGFGLVTVCVCLSGDSGRQCGPPGCVSGALGEILWTGDRSSVGQTLQCPEGQTALRGVGHHGDPVRQSAVSVTHTVVSDKQHVPHTRVILG